MKFFNNISLITMLVMTLIIQAFMPGIYILNVIGAYFCCVVLALLMDFAIFLWSKSPGWYKRFTEWRNK